MKVSGDLGIIFLEQEPGAGRSPVLESVLGGKVKDLNEG